MTLVPAAAERNTRSAAERTGKQVWAGGPFPEGAKEMSENILNGRGMGQQQKELYELYEQQKQTSFWLRAILDACPLGCQIRNSSYEMVDCNHAAALLFGYETREEYLKEGMGRVYHRLRPWEEIPEDKIRAALGKVRKEGSYRRECIVEDRNGIGIPCEILMVCINDREDFLLVSYLRDLREIAEKEERIEKSEKRSNFDELTGIYSRRYFLEESGRLLEYCDKQGIMFGVILFSVDRFRILNSDYGRAAGDGVLCAISELMYSNKKLNQNQVYGRFAGSKFIISLIGYDLPGTWKLAEDIREEVEGLTYYQEEEPLFLTLSLGVSIYKGQYREIAELLFEAEQAMYDARMSGGNCVRIYEQETREIVSISHFL